MIRSKFFSALCLASLMAIVPVANAQRNSNTTAGDFAGIWKGTLPMDAIYDIPAADVARLSKPVDLELRIFSRGGVEIYFSSDADEWEFTENRGYRITPIGDGTQNAVIAQTVQGTVNWWNSIALNLAKKDDETLVLSWTRLVTRAQLLNDGLDTMGFAGNTELKLSGSADDDGGKKKKKKK